MSNTISQIKLGGTIYDIIDTSKASVESVLEFGEITSENNSLLISTNSKLDELLSKLGNSQNKVNYQNFQITEFYPPIGPYKIINGFVVEETYLFNVASIKLDENGDLYRDENERIPAKVTVKGHFVAPDYMNHIHAVDNEEDFKILNSSPPFSYDGVSIEVNSETRPANIEKKEDGVTTDCITHGGFKYLNTSFTRVYHYGDRSLGS